MPNTMLFLCTGNYYRSRFAEELFNDLALKHSLDWSATSRALAIEVGIYNYGPISTHTLSALTQLNVKMIQPIREPIQCSETDLSCARRIIAMKEAEHRPYLSQRYPAWPDRVEYWHIHDLDKATPAEALSQIAEKVSALVAELKKPLPG